VVPDGRLNLVSLTALPVAGGRYLVDEGPVIHYVSAERDLVGEQADAVGRGLLAVGGPAFDDASLFAAAPPAARQSASGAASASRRGAADGSCLTLQSVSFAPLDGSRREAAEIASVWSGSPALVLDGREASEAAFKRDALGRRVLHLATHGFFLGDGCTPATAGTRSVGGLTTRPSTRAKGQPAVPVDNPLLLSGLALAGANRRALAGPRDEDGILTAEEVAALNLDEVEWAVLSACDTGLGEVRAGEGVLGLRRAFRMAGVRTVIMSLWSVEDEATRRWMRALYEARFTDRLDTAQAVHRASLAMLNQRRASDQSTHPFYWAAFVADGAWR
jgi:CHAT domain-containing protein